MNKNIYIDILEEEKEKEKEEEEKKKLFYKILCILEYYLVLR